MRRPRRLDEAWFRSRIALGSGEPGRLLLTRVPGADRRKSVGPTTEVCIDGFPRSGNTFATQAFREWNPEVPIAHHTHLPGQLRAAIRRSLPTALLLRDPADAVASLITFNGGRFSAAAGLAAYEGFHRPLLSCLDQLVICRFADFVIDPGAVIGALNERFGSDFRCERLEPAELDQLRARIERMQRNHGHAPSTFSVPGNERAEMQAHARQEVLAAPELDRARELFGSLASGSAAAGG